jgi:hypothetical protein
VVEVSSGALSYYYTTKQVDVSNSMRLNGVVEAAITSIFYQIFQEKCDPAKNGGKRGLFVDVGANFGWFSVLAAKMGCRCAPAVPCMSIMGCKLSGVLP